MPNYRKKKQQQSNSNNRNKNKNKNSNQNQNKNKSNTTSSSSVKQEQNSDLESPGIEPNLPADVCFSSATSSTSELRIDKGVVSVDDSSPSSNEEINENACNVDIKDTCSSEAKTVLTQSNYSSSFSSSSTNKSTEIERKSESLAYDGDITLGNSTDTFETGSGINSLKTGSTNTKDAAVPTAEKSATRLTEATSISEDSADKNKSGSGIARDEAEPSGLNVIVLKETSSTATSGPISSREIHSSKVIVHKKSTKSKSSAIDHIETANVPEIGSHVLPTEGIVHQISKEDTIPTDQQSKVITHQISKEDFKPTSPIATEQQTKVVSQPTSPAAFTKEENQSPKVNVHQIFREDSTQPRADSPPTVTTPPTSKIIVHQVEEYNATTHIAAKKVADQLPKVITQQSTKKKAIRSLTSSLRNSQEIENTQIDESSKDEFKPSIPVTTTKEPGQISKVIVHQISKEEPNQTSVVAADQQTKVISHQISKEESEGTRPIVADQQFKGITHQTSKEESKPISPISAAQPSKVIVHQISKEEFKETSPIVEDQQTVISHQISKEDFAVSSPFAPLKEADKPLKLVIHPILRENSPQLREDSPSKVDPSSQNASKVIVHQISKEEPLQSPKVGVKKRVSFDATPQEISKVIIHEIEREDSEPQDLLPEYHPKASVHQISSEEFEIPTEFSSPDPVEIPFKLTEVIETSSTKAAHEQCSFEILTQPIAFEEEPSLRKIVTTEAGQSPKEIVIPIQLETLTQTSSPLAKEQSVASPKEIIIPILIDNSIQKSQPLTPTSHEDTNPPTSTEEDNLPSKVIFEQISGNRSPEPKNTSPGSVASPFTLTDVIETSKRTSSTKETREQSSVDSVTQSPAHEERPHLGKILTKETRQSPKEIVIPIQVESLTQITTPLQTEPSGSTPKGTTIPILIDDSTPKSYSSAQDTNPPTSTEDDDLPSKVIFEQISRNRSPEPKNTSPGSVASPFTLTEVIESSKRTSSTKETREQSSVDLVTQPLAFEKRSSFPKTITKEGGQSPKEIVIPIQVESSTQITSPLQTELSGSTPKETIIPILIDNSTQKSYSSAEDINPPTSTDEDNFPSKVIFEQISRSRISEPKNASPSSVASPVGLTEVIETSKLTSSTKESREQSSVETVTQPPTFEERPHLGKISTKEAAQSPKEIVIPIQVESSTQITSPLQTEASGSTPKETIIPILIDVSTQKSHSSTQDINPPTSIDEDDLPSKVIFEQISRTRTSEPNSTSLTSPTKVIVHPILQERSTQNLPVSEETTSTATTNHSESAPVAPPTTSFPVCRSPKVIVHQICREGTVKPVFPFTPKSLQKLDDSSKKIARQILQDVSSELKSSFHTERENRTTQQESIGPVRTSFPLSLKKHGPFHPGFFESYTLQTQSNPIHSQAKVIVHQISTEDSKTNRTGFPLNSPAASFKPEVGASDVVVQETSRQESKPIQSGSTSTSSSSYQHSTERSVQSSSGTKSVLNEGVTHQKLGTPLSSSPLNSPSTDVKFQPTKSEASPKVDLGSKTIVHQISREDSTLVSQQPSNCTVLKRASDHSSPVLPPFSKGPTLPPLDLSRTKETESRASPDISTSSSEESVLTAIQVKSPQSVSPPSPENQKVKSPKSPRSSFFLTSLDMANQTKTKKSDSSDTETLRGGSAIKPEEDAPKASTKDMSTSQQGDHSPKVIVHQIIRETPATSPPEERDKTPPETGKAIIHPIVREIVTEKPLAYRVESPQPETRLMISRKSKSLDDEDVVIQEMSDTSSAGDTENPPLVSEAESETDTLEALDDFPDTPIDSRVLSVQTIPIDHEDDSLDGMSPKTAQDYKIRRQQNRAALEYHFLPQFLSPNFLDSIKEENSDLSDSDRRSECSDRTDHAVQQGDLEDDVFLEGGPHAKKADAVFPKSNLDFSKKHKPIHTNVRPPHTSVIREEAPPPSVVAAKIIDQESVEESCSKWSTNVTPESEAAEVVYIDSASSSVSDLLELDYSQGQADDSIDVRIQTPTIDLESVNEMFASHQSESNERVDSPPPPIPPQLAPLPPVKEQENMSAKISTPPLASTDVADRGETKTALPTEIPTTPTAVEHKIPDEIILEKIETMSETVAAANDHDADVAASADRAQNSKANNPNSCDSAINEVVTNETPSVVVGLIEKMENLREIVSASIQSELDRITDPDRDIPKLNFKIGEPCSDHTLKCDTTTSSSTTSSSSSTTTTTTTSTSTTTGKQILTLHDLSKTLGDTKHLHPLGSSSSALDRQESLDSHGSDQSQSTNQSQCTAINQGSCPQSDWNEFDTATDTTYVSGSDTAGLASSENSSPITTGGARSADDTESPPIRKLRSLCTEALASMPYGEDVLEELATVANNIGDMPYPLPELPHIQDIQVSLRSEPQKTTSVITLTQVPPKSTPGGQKFTSPPPPPVPEPPSKYDSWLGVQTEGDPSVLVCLSPSQRGVVKNDSTPDSLLDMHKKFVERRGYHEYTTKQVDAMNKENSYEAVKLSKSNSPPLPPVPPRPSQAPKSNGNETAGETDINTDDQNNHRLLAIIRDTHDSQQQQHHQHQQKSSTTSSSENISRRTESGPNTTIPTNTTTTTATTTNGGGGQEEFANSQSVSKQTQERFVSESNQSHSAHEEMQTGKREHTIKVDREPIMGVRFPTSEYFDSIFDGTNKRFSNIETRSSPGFCSQILSTQPKRYSNIETSSFESRKCIENGKVLYDVSDSNRQKISEGEKPDSSGPTSFPESKIKANVCLGGFPIISTAPIQADSRTQAGDSENVMSAFKLKTQMTAPPPVPTTHRVETSPPAPPVPPLPPTLIDTTATTTTTKSTSSSERVINRNFNGETKETTFDDFRQRAKEAPAAGGEHSSTGTRKSDVFDHEKLFKDFDELSNLLKDELESGKRRPPATLDGSAIPSSVSDYNRVARESKVQSSHVSSSTTEHSRREQMKKLAEEIDRTAAQRQQTRREMRIPIRVEKPTPTPPRSAPAVPQQPRSYEIPVQVENGTRRTYEIPVRTDREIPVQVEKGTDTRSDRHTLHHQRSYEIPVRVEHQTGTRQRTQSEYQPDPRSHEVPIRVERPQEQPERFRRAESMFNISDTTANRHMLHDDWMKYVGDLGSSENICKPFQREVEICYLGRRPNIRAPRLSASTSDLSSTHSYDTYGAYDVRRTTKTQTLSPQQPPRRRFTSSQSMIDTTPITPCISSCRSPVRERRSSLPREIHDQQLKFILTKEEQLQSEFERLESERRQLIDEMNRAQINQRINREAYRQRQLPPLTEDESFRQQMAEEWLNKVAEREERRLQKIIKISKINQDANFPAAPPRRVSSSDIGDEFLRRVKERRSKLCMPSDSDWESGAESQPAARNDGSRSENEEPPMTVLEGQSQADITQLPKHLREFAKLSNQVKEEHREETTENTSCSATKKSSIVTTVKTSNATNTNNQHNTQEVTQSQQSLQQDAARARDLEQLSQGKRQKLVTILRHKKPAESSSSSGGCQPVPTAVGSATAGSGGANSVKRRKQTRFLLTPNRRSWSESDLLREIDKELVLARGFLYANGVWTPKNQTPSSSRTNLNEFQPHNTANSPTTINRSDKISENRSSSACGRNEKSIPTPPPPPLWTPQPERKQFRPVHFESPVLQRRYVRQQSTPSQAPPPPWSYTNSQPFPGYQSSQSCTNLNQKKSTAIPWPPQAATVNHNGTAIVGHNSPVVDDNDDFAPTTSIAEKIRSFERSTSNSELHRPFVRHNPYEKAAILRPNEVIYSVKNEYMSEPETEYDKPKKMAQLSRRQYDGIGPTTMDGMPVVLRSEVKEPNQHEWYKRIFQTIHKQKNPDDYVTIRYKCPRGRYPYKSNGYMSEPEPNYDSDYSTVKYRTLERRRLQSTGTGTGSGTFTGPSAGNDSQGDTVYGTMPNPVKSGQGSYKVQPGRIEDYVTGHSSVSEKEKKEWWDEVMDIFNGWLRDNDPTLPRVFIEFANEVEQFQLDQQKLSPHYTEGNLSRALLKEQGYTSDSNLVFRKKDVPQLRSPLSPVEQKQVYKSVQAGGQPPLLGFRKPAPEKPKETEFEYLPITPTLTKIRVHSKQAMSKKSQTTHAAQRELICYPITNLSRPIDMFAPFPKHVPSFIPMNQPPLPPNRKSSRTRTTSMALKISSSEVRRPTSANSSRHEACFQTKDAMSPPPPKPTKYGTITLKKTVRRTEPIVRSKSAGAVVGILTAAKEEKTKDGRVSRKHQTIRLSSCSPVRSASRLTTLRTSSRSPVAFGRSVSKERSFAEEKKRIEETMPSIRTDFTASTNILRDPSLRSPDQVKRAVRSYALPMERSKSAPRVMSPAKPTTSSYMSTYVVRRVPSPARKEVPIAKRSLTSATVKSPAIVRSKSQSSKLGEKSHSKTMTKTSSTLSLARTSSTFSVDSTAATAKPIPKKPLTITRPSARTETEKAKRKPVTISSSKSDSNVLRKIKESSETKEKIVKAIPSQQKIVRTNHFFTNLFMRDTSPRKYDASGRQASVHEKTRYWNTMSLPSKKSVSDSRHLAYHQCRSLSPPVRPQYVEQYESMEHFQSDDEGSEFGDRSGRTEDLVWQYEQRSRSGRPMRPISDIARPESPARVFPGEFSPTREIRVPQTREMRSPSRRRIQSFRGSQRGETGKVIRASSLSSADDRTKSGLYLCDDISLSANSLEYIERHRPQVKNSTRFIDLNRFYSTLERVGQLERATSASSLKPIRKEGQAMDFEEWRKLRLHERAERELNYLVGRLKEDQKQKDFLFRPKDVEDVKWSENKDLSLRSKDKSVEDLRENFEKKIHQEWLDESKRQELESRKDTYKPYWRGSSVVDLASSMEVKYNPESGSFGVHKVKAETTPEKPLCLSNRLISTLSKDQVSKITQQLNEIYNASEPKAKPDVTEEYVITVDQHMPANALKVRSHSSISKEELIGPVLRRREASGKPAQSKTFDRLSRKVNKSENELTETEKRRLSQTLSREFQGKTRSGSPVMLARETRGAIAAENAKSTLPDIPPPPPLPKNLFETKKPAPAKPKRKFIESEKRKKDDDVQENALKIETTTTETMEKPDDVSKKIQYFEERQFEEPAKTIYHARQDSSPDEDEVMRIIEENIRARAQSETFHHQEMSSSMTNIKDLFGERQSSRINFPLPRPPPPPDETIYHETKQDQHRSTSLTLSASRDGSLENLEAFFRSRSISPQSTSASYLHRVHTGEVRKIKDKFESLGRPKKKKHFFASTPLRRVRSDPELSNDGSKDTLKTVVREHEIGDVSWIAHKFEVQNSTRGRSRCRKPGSPIQRMPLRKDDRLMPHIDIISKTASLKQEMMKSRSPSPVRQQATLHAGEVERIRCIFETSPDRDSPLRQPHLGTSSPELRDISAHLTASWIAHKYPKPLDNDLRSPPPLPEKLAKSTSLPPKEAKRPERPYRSRSISPPKTTQKQPQPIYSILKPRFDFFANQKFDPSIHRPKARYVPDSGDGIKKPSAVKFKDSDDVPPPLPVPPTKGVSLDSNGFSNLESPNRYFESDVNIHYKTPIRYEYKDPIPEEELAIRQAESMQKLYQEERRRKYLQELQDMNSRRHTDNYTPTQKSPIPLNRYDDFNSDLAPKSPSSSNYPKTIARALYNFQGQTARELTFKKGDVIYIRRQIDKNWYEGEHNAMIGLLPSNYVELITKDGVRQPPKKPSEGQARAKYNFQAQSGIELSLNKGEHVTLTRRVDDNWFEGKIANRKGIFPVSYVEVLVDIGAEDKAARVPASQSIITQSSSMRPSLDTLRTNINNEFNSLTSNGQPPNGILRETRTLHKTEVLHVDTNTEPVAYRALYKYRPQNTDELELQEGDVVFVLEKCDDGWFVGTSQRSGCFGTFPGNYVERV